MKRTCLAVALAVCPMSPALGAGPGWRIDEGLKYQLVYLPTDEARQERGAAQPLVPLLTASPAFSPDITNIVYSDILALGFPLPLRKGPSKLKLYLKLYRWPERIDGRASARRILDAFLLHGLAGGSRLYDFAAIPENLAVKRAWIGPGDRTFSADRPLPAPGPVSQEEFDSSIPFSSVYVTPAEEVAPGAPEAEKAAASARGVLAVHAELLRLYDRSLLRLEDSADKVYYALRQRCARDERRICGLRVFELPKKPLVFANYRDLPMPQDPERVFLSGLLLVKLVDYAARTPYPDGVPPSPSSRAFRSAFRPTWAQMLEVGSVLDLRVNAQAAPAHPSPAEEEP